MQNKRLELMMGIAEKELSGLASIFDELSSTLGDKLMEAIDLIDKTIDFSDFKSSFEICSF